MSERSASPRQAIDASRAERPAGGDWLKSCGLTPFDGISALAVDPGDAVDFIEDLRQSEYDPPSEVGRYLDLLRSRAKLIFDAELDTGWPGMSDVERCQRAVLSLMRHRWFWTLDRGRARRVGPALSRPRAPGMGAQPPRRC
jgi:hypothetical protein